MVGVTGLGSLGGRESRHSAVRRHTAWGQPAARGCGVRLVWPQTNELPDLSPPVPVAQEWSADLNRTLSRKEKKKNADGVTLMGINQTGDQASQNKPSRWALGTSVPGKAKSSARAGMPLPRETPQRGPAGNPGASFQMLCWAAAKGLSWENLHFTQCQSCRKIRRRSLCHSALWAPCDGKN